MSHLDQLSTSPTGLVISPSKSAGKCQNGAPYFAFKIETGKFGVIQGCCNDWTCARCGQMRARQEYGRIVEGCKIIAQENRLLFITITCKGRGLSVRDSLAHYGEWSERFLDACYTRSKRKGGKWVYVAVTERQKRGHPHSHILTTFNPLDLYLGHVFKWHNLPQGGGRSEREIALRSDWLAAQVVRAGLGDQYDVSIVNSAAAASRYVAKYMFKDTIFNTQWPKGWKRVRYSQSFPKLAKRETDAFVLRSANDWFELAADAQIVITYDEQSHNIAKQALAPYPVKVVEKRQS